MQHIDLFSGIGGFALAADQVWPDIKHTFVEHDPFCQAVLKKHYPNSTIHGDIDEYVVQLTGLSAKEYNALHGLSTVEQIRERKEPLSKRDVSARHRELLRNIETGDVEDTLTKGMRDAEQFTIQGEQPLSQGDKSERQGTEHSGEGDTERFSGASDTLREVQGHGDIQRRADENTSTPPGLQQTTGGNVAVSEMSSRMAQTLQSNQLEHGRITTDTQCSGWKGEGNKTTRQHGLSYRTSTDKEPFILTGGFPCQEFSHAGKRKGTAGARYKWPEMLSVIHFYKPEWVIAENVRGLTTWEQGLALETVLTNLEECGYSVWPLIIPACSVGAPHRRDRVWIVAHSNSGKQRAGLGSIQKANGEVPEWNDYAEPSDTDTINTTPNPGQQLREQGSGEGMEASPSERTTCAEANQRECEYTWADDWREVALATCHDGVDDGLPRRMGGVTISAARHRKEQLKAYGNAIVPQVAEEIMRAICSARNVKKK